MDTHTPVSHTAQRATEQGMALVVVLIFMLALSTMAIFSARNATFGERQARNELEYQVARQAAEAALRDAENDLRIPEPNGLFQPTGATCSREGSALRQRGVASLESGEFTTACTTGQCGMPAARYAVAWSDADPDDPGTPWWPTSKGGLWGNKTSVASANCATFTGGVPLGTFTGAPDFPGVARQPEYMIELLVPESTAAAESLFECTGKSSPGSSSVLASADETGSGGSGTSSGTCYLFRITARGFGASERNDQIDSQPNPMVEVLLQSYFQLYVK